jgi:hypothetical protein
MKKYKITYWITTGLLALFILPGIFFLNKPFAIEGTAKLGLPLWLHYEVGIAQFIGGLILILPWLGKRLKEWAYVGMGIVYLTATIAHLSVEGILPMSFSPLINFALLLVSYICFHKIQDSKNPDAQLKTA